MKKENGRIRKLIDTAYYVDPRIKKFRDEDREKKEAIKKAKKQEIYDRKQKGVEVRNLDFINENTWNSIIFNV